MEYVALESPDSAHAQAIYAHGPDQCVGQVCCIHRRTDHHLRGWPQNFRPDRMLMERVCPHGVGHPDPDHMSYVTTIMAPEDSWAEGIHGCDGCCTNQHEETE